MKRLQPRARVLVLGALTALAAQAAACGDGGTTPAAPSPTVAAAETEPAPTATATAFIATEFTLSEVIDASILDLGAYWRFTMQEVYGIPYTDIESAEPYFASTGEVPSCGGPPEDPAEYIGNAFYCPIGDYIAWDAEELFPELYDEYGDFAVALALAHEWGHAVQARAGVSGLSILTELQADCFAGAWTQSVAAGESEHIALSPGDLDEAVAGFVLFRDTPGTSVSEEDAHGSAFDRVNAFAEGYEQGATRCAAYEAQPPVIVPLEFRTQEEFDSGGDLAYGDIAPLMLTDLEDFWTQVMPEAYGIAWEPLAAVAPYYPSDASTLPPCGEDAVAFEAFPYNAYYCAADDYIAWDDEELMPGLYDSIGDFAVALVIGHEWGHAVQARAGIEGPSRFDLEQQADCFAGAWVAWIVLEQSPNLTLSPGDLDEAILGYLVMADDPAGVPEAARTGTSFQRVAAFQDGVVDGMAACEALAR